jgi:hypothetical protein
LRSWDPAAAEADAFNRLPDVDQKRVAIAQACAMIKARTYRPNSDAVFLELARREVDCFAMADSLSHVVEVPRPSDGSPRHWRLYPKDHPGHHTRLGQSLFALCPNAKRVVSDPKAPKRPRWWECIQDMRLRWA